jgi:hypothetical protein
MSELSLRRRRRTIASHRVRSMVEMMVTDPAPRVGPDDLPSWWPFWSDSLRNAVCAVVRAARELEEIEAVL